MANMVGVPPLTSEIGCPLGVCGGAGKFLIGITLAVWQLATRCLILGVGFWGQAIQLRHSRDGGSKDVVMATNFGTKIAITGFV